MNFTHFICILKNVFVFYFKNYQAELTVLKMEPIGPPLSLSKNQHQSGGFSARSFKRSGQTDIFFFKKLFGRLRYLRLIYVPKLRLRYLDMNNDFFFLILRRPFFYTKTNTMLPLPYRYSSEVKSFGLKQVFVLFIKCTYWSYLFSNLNIEQSTCDKSPIQCYLNL